MGKCLHCGANLAEGHGLARFCPQCGTPLTSQFKNVETERERKFVCILFADLSGFTALSERLDPEEVTDLISECMNRLGKRILDFEGTIDKFMGDAVMALFGAPIAHENDPRRAVECALELLKEIRIISEERNIALELSIGINSGIVVAGGIGTEGKMDYTVMGDAVNVAQRLQSAAPANQIYVSENIYRAVQKDFEFAPVAPLTLKGKSAPQLAHSVIRSLELQVDSDTHLTAMAPLVGRENEFAKLKGSLLAAQAGVFQKILITGEPGAGKSRLLLELKREALSQKMPWLISFPSSTVKEKSYGAIRRILLQVEDLVENFESFNASLGLNQIEAEILSSWRRDIPFPASHGMTAELLNENSASLFQKVVRIFSQNQPCVLVFEDLHWIDSSSKALLLQIINTWKDQPVLLILTGRPEVIQSIEEGGLVPKIDLEPLTSDQINSLVKHLLKTDTLSNDFVAALSEKSDGNPLFIEELIKHLIEEGQITLINDQWQISEGLNLQGVPSQLRSLIASRIDRLKPLERLVLQAASILGRHFQDTLLCQLLSPDTTESDVYESLRQLRRRELIFEHDLNESGITYIFKHALVRDVSYGSLLLKRRKELHFKAGEIIEQNIELYPQHLSLLAYHFKSAEHRTKAVDYLQLSAIKAADSFDRPLAIRHFEDALELIRTAPEESLDLKAKWIDLSIRLDTLYQESFDLKSSEGLLQALAQHAKAHSDSALLSQVYRRLGGTCEMRGDLEAALHWLQQSLVIAEQSEDSNQEVRTCKALANVFGMQHQLDRALHYLQRGLEKLKSLKDLKLEADFLNDLGLLFNRRKDYPKAEEALSECMKLCQAIGEMKPTMIAATINTGVLKFYQNDFSAAREEFENAAALAEEIGARKYIIQCRRNVAGMYQVEKNFEKALTGFETSLQLAEEVGLTDQVVSSLVGKAEALVGLDRSSEALKVLETSQQLSQSRKLWFRFAESAEQRALITDRLGHRDRAMGILQHALEQVRKNNLPDLIQKIELQMKMLKSH